MIPLTVRIPVDLQHALRGVARMRREKLNQVVERALRDFVASAAESLPPPREIDLLQTAMIPELELPPYKDEVLRHGRD